MNKERIKAKAILGLPLTAQERAVYLLFIANEKEMNDFLYREKEVENYIANVFLCSRNAKNGYFAFKRYERVVKECAERLKKYARACKASGYDGIGENDISL